MTPELRMHILKAALEVVELRKEEIRQHLDQAKDADADEKAFFNAELEDLRQVTMALTTYIGNQES